MLVVKQGWELTTVSFSDTYLKSLFMWVRFGRQDSREDDIWRVPELSFREVSNRPAYIFLRAHRHRCLALYAWILRDQKIHVAVGHQSSRTQILAEQREPHRSIWLVF